MPPNQSLVHLKEYDVKDSNVELIGTDIDHRIKHKSAATEPAWNTGSIGTSAGLHVWRIENFEVVPWPKEKYGQFYDGDSFIVLNSYKIGNKDGSEKLGHDIFFWLGSHTSQDEAGTAAYKTVELDEFLSGAASQHREIQESPSDAFLKLFPRISIRSGGVASGFRHVEETGTPEITTLLRVFTNPGAGIGKGVVVHEVKPNWKSLDDGDVFVLDKGDKIWVWQGKDCSPMEKAKAAQVVHEMTLAKHVDVEVVAQSESRSQRIVNMLGGDDDTPRNGFKQERPFAGTRRLAAEPNRQKKLFRLTDSSGQLRFDQVDQPAKSSLDGNDVFLLDSGNSVWVWEGQQASSAEKAVWLRIAQAYIKSLQEKEHADAHLTPLAKVVQGYESQAFMKAIEV